MQVKCNPDVRQKKINSFKSCSGFPTDPRFLARTSHYFLRLFTAFLVKKYDFERNFGTFLQKKKKKNLKISK